MIYFDNSATSLIKPDSVKNAVYNAISNCGGSGRGAYEASLNSNRVLFNARKKISALFNCDNPSRVSFSHNATEALNIAILGMFKGKSGRIITTLAEHNSVLRPLYRLVEDEDIELDFLPLDENEAVRVDRLEEIIKNDTLGVVCTHISNVTGNITDVKRVGEICFCNKIPFIVDASQSAGCHHIDMKDMKIDILCFTGHKSLFGVQGTGGLCVREGVEIEPLIVGGSGIHSFSHHNPKDMPEKLEYGTPNAHGLSGLIAGIDYINEVGLDKIIEKEIALKNEFISGIENIKNVVIYGDYKSSHHAGVVSINIGNIDSASISNLLYTNYEICTRSGIHCAPLMHTHLNTENQGAVRFSFSYLNTLEEVHYVVNAVKEISSLYDKGEL